MGCFDIYLQRERKIKTKSYVDNCVIYRVNILIKDSKVAYLWVALAVVCSWLYYRWLLPIPH